MSLYYTDDDGKRTPAPFVANGTWCHINETLGIGKKDKKKQLPTCQCGTKLQFKRLPNAEVTSDSQSHYWCFSCDIYTPSEPYDVEADAQALELKMFRGLKQGKMIQVGSE